MKRISIVTSILITSSIAFIIGCGGNNSTAVSSNTTATTKTVTVKASDAYVVNLPDPATITLTDGSSYATTKVMDGTIIFDNIPSDSNLDGAKVYVPDSAIVDTDGDGQYSDKDQNIRMHLSLLMKTGTENIANPITTAAVANDDTETLEKYRDFDPVSAKEQLIENYDEKLAKLVALSDGIANAVQEAKEKGIPPEEAIKDIDTQEIDEVVENPTIDVTTALESTIRSADETSIQKAVAVVEIAKEASKFHKEGKIDKKEALVAMLAVSDGGVDPNQVKDALTQGKIEEIVNMIPSHKEKNNTEIANNETSSKNPYQMVIDAFNGDVHGEKGGTDLTVGGVSGSEVPIPPFPPLMQEEAKNAQDNVQNTDNTNNNISSSSLSIPTVPVSF